MVEKQEILNFLQKSIVFSNSERVLELLRFYITAENYNRDLSIILCEIFSICHRLINVIDEWFEGQDDKGNILKYADITDEQIYVLEWMLDSLEIYKEDLKKYNINFEFLN